MLIYVMGSWDPDICLLIEIQAVSVCMFVCVLCVCLSIRDTRGGSLLLVVDILSLDRPFWFFFVLVPEISLPGRLSHSGKLSLKRLETELESAETESTEDTTTTASL